MPRRILTTDGVAYRFDDYELSDPVGDEVRVRAEFAAPKHGTEKQLVGGSVLQRKRFDRDLRMYFPQDDTEYEAEERGIGNMVVGTVTATGPDARSFSEGDRVFGYGAIQEEHQSPQGNWRFLGHLTPSDAVCVDPAHVALVAVRDGEIRVGDNVAVFGLGAIGLMAVQIARLAGAHDVFAVDPIEVRRECARQHGADAALDPTRFDVALQIKRATEEKGVDVAIETSGNAQALHEAIRCLMQCGTVVHVPWGPADCSGLRLNEEFHMNRITIVGSQAWAGWGNADRDHPRWTHERTFDTAVQLFRDRKLSGEGVVSPIVPFDEAPDALRMIFEKPEETIKVGVRMG